MIAQNRSIFDQLKNQNFFSPLTSKYARLYYDVALQLLDISLSNPIIPYKAAIARTDNCIEKYKLQEGAFKDREDSLSAAEVLSTLKDYGWVTPKRLTADNRDVITMTKDCIRITSALKEYSESGDTGMMNHLYVIRDILRDVLTNKDKSKSGRRNFPYQLVYKELVKHSDDLALELVELFNSIDDITKSVMNAKNPKEYYETFFDGSFKGKFFKSYMTMKDGGHLPYLLTSIQEGIEQIKLDEELMRNTVSEFAALTGREEWDVEREILNKYTDIENYLSTSKESDFQKRLKEIDDKLNNYIDNLASRFGYIFNSQGALKEAVDKYLGCIEVNGLENAPDLTPAIRIQSIKTISEESTKITKEREGFGEAVAIEKESLSNEEKERRTAELKASMQNPYSMKVVAAYLDYLLGNNTKLILDNRHITDKEVAMKFAAGITFSGATGFNFKVTMLNQYIESNEIRMKNIMIERV